MGFLNRKKKRAERANTHLNWMGGPSYDINDSLKRLRYAASSCFFGEPMYYQRDSQDKRPARKRPPVALSDEDVTRLRELLNAIDPREWRGMTPAELMESAIDAALAADPEATLKEAVRLRQVDHIRTTPQVILVRAANHPAVRGTGLVRRYAPQIIARADEPAVGLAYQRALYGKPIPNALKKAWRDALEKANEYALAKYRLESRTVKLVDVANLVHPKSEAVNKLVRGELRLTDQTWEAIISAKGASKESWEQALPLMGHMALLRNLRNLLEQGVDPKAFKDTLIKGAAEGKQLPFRYYSAYRAVEKIAPPSVLDAIEECLNLALGNLPTFPGRVMSLCDNSGSARGTTTSSMGKMQISTIANLTAILTAMQSGEGYVGIFGDKLDIMAVRKRSSLFDQLKEVDKRGSAVGGGTENGVWLFWDEAIRTRQHWDVVFIYSDMQAGHGGLYGTDPGAYSDFIWSGKGNRYIDVPKLIATYRRQVNPQVLVFLVQVAGYQDTIVPEFYDKTYILGGWSDGVLRFAAEMAGLNNLPSAEQE
ncbi:MAG TPA: TROVE domain-containing protein [Aggregatilineales bacterium]|nr:TROVE domain-containing protein [Anaerolineales bacterium]HRE49014.1 TROVE domain-containing protein [Aggregatilineales bacterium]